MRGDEVIVVQVRVGGINAVNLLTLARAETFTGVKTPDTFKQPLPPQHLVQTGDATGEVIRCVEKGRVAVGHFNGTPQEFGGNGAAAFNGPMTLPEQFNRLAGPDRPVTQQTAYEAALYYRATHLGATWCEQVEHYVVIVAGVKGQVVAAGFGDSANDVERLVAVEGGEFDGNDVFDLQEAPPECEWQHTTTHRRLQVETHYGQNLRHSSAMRDQLVVASALHRRQAQQTGMIAKLAEQPGLARRLRRFAADAANAHQRLAASSLGAVQLFGSKLQYWFKKAVARVANGELCGMHADSHTPHPGSRVIAQRGALTRLIQLASGIEGERAGGNYQSSLECLLDVGRQGHGSESPVACFKMGRLVQRRPVVQQPRGDPGDQLVGVNARLAEQAERSPGIAQQYRRGFLSHEDRCPAQE